ncbi:MULTISPECIES: hypothetical protein [Clostridia]|uniref:Cap15 family cyclic dinucleotide receptor domain-containing protein n=1 Tax=Clostridia TaxID=186801 RepID=UPI00067F5C1E|nr:MULTISPECIES: hypothetical protein [Clostridia]
MHTYTIDKSLRSKMILNIFIASIILSALFTFLLGDVISEVRAWMQNYKWLAEILNLCDRLGVTTNFIGVTFLYGALYWGFDNFVWRWKIVKKFLNVPDLRGHWEGELTSTTYKTKLDMKLDVKQTWSKISFVSTFPKSKSESNVAAIFIERDGIVKIGFGFINHSREFPHQYDGYNILDMDDDNHLFGRYFNNRDNSNVGNSGGNMGTFELRKYN